MLQDLLFLCLIVRGNSYLYTDVFLNLSASSTVVLVENAVQVNASDATVPRGVVQSRLFSAQSELHVVQDLHHESSVSDAERPGDSLREVEDISHLIPETEVGSPN